MMNNFMANVPTATWYLSIMIIFGKRLNNDCAVLLRTIAVISTRNNRAIPFVKIIHILLSINTEKTYINNSPSPSYRLCGLAGRCQR